MQKGRMLARIAAVALIGCSAADHDPHGQVDGSPIISLNSVSVDVRDPSAAIPPSLRADPADARAQRYALVKFPGPITADQDRALRRVAAKVYTYLPYYSYLVRMDGGERSASALAEAGAIWSGPYHPYYKMSRQVSSMTAEEASPNTPRSVMLQIYPDADLDAVVAEIRRTGAGEVAGWQAGAIFSRIRWMVTPAEIARHREAIARIPEVFWVDIEPRKAILNDTTIWVGQSGLNGNMGTPVFDQGIYGQGQVVGIIDTGIDPDMCYFRDDAAGPPPRNECNGGTVIDAAQRKVLAVDFLAPGECAGGIGNTEWDTQDHGSHVAGTVAGDNFANPLIHDPGDGMAPGAKLVIQDGGYQVDNCGDLPGIGCPVVDLKPIFQQAYTQGARIHTDSWGDQENNPKQNNYTAACQDVDEFMWTHKDFLLFFAAGNSGNAAGSVGSPSTAKSAVSVGATQHGASAGQMASFSSCGPTDDGRIKPEITIPGANIVSADNDNNASSNNCGTRTMSGTSMASPGAAGLTALIRQYYVDGFYPSGAANAADGFTPSAALMRATLVNSGEPMNNGIIPANCQAWGRILLDNSLSFAGESRKLWVDDDAMGFATGSVNETKSVVLSVKQGATPFKATLAWTDYPSTPAANPHINNDLDLEVVGPGGTYHGNVFAGGQSQVGGNPDRVNTLEQVFLKTPLPGTYTVTVRSFNVPNGPQPFALVVTGLIAPASPLGAPCATAADCQSGFCADGVCCDTACNAGICDACSIAAGAAADGTCALFTGPACDDGSACTQMDTCQAGVCVGSPVVCPAPDDCHDPGACDANGKCTSPAKLDGTPCSDGDICTHADTCQAGKCTGSPVVCPASDECHLPAICDSATGMCAGLPEQDGTPCPGGVCVGGVCNAANASSGNGGVGGSVIGTTTTGSGQGGGGGGGPLEFGGCGCRTASAPEGGGVGALGLGILIAARGRRRRRAARRTVA